jgi:hypothetical protein
MERKLTDAQGKAVGEDRFTLAIFPVNQYLGDAALQKATVDLASSGSLKPADAQALLPFHPLNMNALKQEHDIDAYCLLGVYGGLVRTHLVMTNGIARTNPPPEGYLCDSCHTKGWLRKDFQNSKIDGANIPVWLCPNCSRLKPEEREVRF